MRPLGDRTHSISTFLRTSARSHTLFARVFVGLTRKMTACSEGALRCSRARWWLRRGPRSLPPGAASTPSLRPSVSSVSSVPSLSPFLPPALASCTGTKAEKRGVLSSSDDANANTTAEPLRLHDNVIWREEKQQHCSRRTKFGLFSSPFVLCAVA